MAYGRSMRWQCRIAASLGSGFAGTPHEVWGTEDYEQNKHDHPFHYDLWPTVFFGLYGLPDFYALWRHKGRKAILWAGSDIQHMLNGYWLDQEGKIRLRAYELANWIATYCENYVENEVEQTALASVGITSKVVPSFLGDVKDYEVCFKPGNKVYTSVSGDDFKLYGWHKIPQLAYDNPNIEFHLYGNTKYFGVDMPNVIIHGRVPQEQMNEETKRMQGALRLTEHDGFSEIVAKSLLWGQYPVSLIFYPHTLMPKNIDMIKIAREPNYKGREWLLNNVNKYPWNINI